MKDSFPPHFQARKEEFLGNSAGRGGWGKAFSFSARRVISARLSGRTFVCNLTWSRAGSGEGSLHAAPRGAGGAHEDPHPEQPSCPPLHLAPPTTLYSQLPPHAVLQPSHPSRPTAACSLLNSCLPHPTAPTTAGTCRWDTPAMGQAEPPHPRFALLGEHLLPHPPTPFAPYGLNPNTRFQCPPP